MDWQETALIAVTVLSVVVTIVLIVKFAKQILRFFLVLLALALTFTLLLLVAHHFGLLDAGFWQTLLLGMIR